MKIAFKISVPVSSNYDDIANVTSPSGSYVKRIITLIDNHITFRAQLD